MNTQPPDTGVHTGVQTGTHTVAEIDHRAFPDADSFRAQIIAQGQPVVLRNIGAAWPVFHAATKGEAALADYLVAQANSRHAMLFLGDPAIAGQYYYGDGPDGFNFRRQEVPLAKALEEIRARAANPALGTAYMGSLITPAFLPDYAAANHPPIVPAATFPRLWLGTASKAACHYDAFDNLAVVVAGQRRFTLFPPEAVADLYVGPIDHTMAGQPVSLATSDPALPDWHSPEHADAYPRFARWADRALVVDLAPGDGLFLPKLWWHQVEGLAPFNLMANYWWDAHAPGPDSPMLAMLLATITLAERPQAERDAFRAFFEHYVFRGSGHPLAHLPPEKRGILSQIDRNAYGQIRAMVLRELRGN